MNKEGLTPNLNIILLGTRPVPCSCLIYLEQGCDLSVVQDGEECAKMTYIRPLTPSGVSRDDKYGEEVLDKLPGIFA